MTTDTEQSHTETHSRGTGSEDERTAAYLLHN